MRFLFKSSYHGHVRSQNKVYLLAVVLLATDGALRMAFQPLGDAEAVEAVLALQEALGDGFQAYRAVFIVLIAGVVRVIFIFGVDGILLPLDFWLVLRLGIGIIDNLYLLLRLYHIFIHIHTITRTLHIPLT